MDTTLPSSSNEESYHTIEELEGVQKASPTAVTPEINDKAEVDDY